MIATRIERRGRVWEWSILGLPEHVGGMSATKAGAINDLNAWLSPYKGRNSVLDAFAHQVATGAEPVAGLPDCVLYYACKHVDCPKSRRSEIVAEMKRRLVR